MLGINIPGRGEISVPRVDDLNARLVRLVYYPGVDLITYISELSGIGVHTLMVMAAESFEGRGWWTVLSEAKAKYGGMVLWQLGNESDHESDSSWTMTQAQVSELLRVGREVLGPDAFILGPGLASGQPSWAETVDWRPANGIAVHPYGKRPTPDWPSPTWGTGYVGDLLDGYKKFGKPLYVTEVGLSTTDQTEALQGEYCGRMMVSLEQKVVDAYWFCYGDAQVPKFGLVRTNNVKKPSYAAFQEAVEQTEDMPKYVLGFKKVYESDPELVGEPVENERHPLPQTAIQATSHGALSWLGGVDRYSFTEHGGTIYYWNGTSLEMVLGMIGPEPGPEPTPEPEKSPWIYWTPEEIAAASGCPVAAIRTDWPLIWAALAEHQIDGYFEQQAAIGTVAIETASTFKPVREAFWLSEEWRRDNLRYYPFYGRGHIQLTWDYNYRTYGGFLGVDLLGNPDLALDSAISARVLARYFVERLVYDAAARQDWAAVRRRVQGGTAGLDRLIQIVTNLQNTGNGHQDTSMILGDVLQAGRTRIGDPYVWGGKNPSGFDCSGFVAWCYGQVGLYLTSFTDSIFNETNPVSTPFPGDVVLFEYVDQSQPGVRFPHVGLVASSGGSMLLDASSNRGVSERAMPALGTLRYRRHKALG